MSALATRLLVLGVVRLFEPANAYQLRRELLSWNVESWANLNPGSIYGMLGTLTKNGLVEAHGLAAVNGRPVTVYTTTPAGAELLPQLAHRAIARLADWGDLVDLRAGLALSPALSREVLLSALDLRIEAMHRAVAMFTQPPGEWDAPPHVTAEFELEERVARAQLGWLLEHRAAIAAGAYSFAGERSDWQPVPGDPGAAMKVERAHYLEQLGDRPD